MRQDQHFLLICMAIQLPNVWEDELHNVVQMSYGTSTPLNSQDADGIIFFILFAQILSYGIPRTVLKFILYLQALCHTAI